MICQKCGRANEDRYKFCLGCGSPLSVSISSSRIDEPPLRAVRRSAGQPFVAEAPIPAALSTFEEPMADFRHSVPLAEPVAVLPPPAAEVNETSQDLAPEIREVSVVAPIVVAERACHVCSTPVNADFLFCGRCGTRYEVPEPEPLEEDIDVDLDDLLLPAGVDTQLTSPVRGRMVLIHPDGTEGEAIALVGGDNLFGRETGSAVLEGDEYLSPHHVRVYCDEEGALVEDVGSVNGTFLRLGNESCVLEHNDQIRVGQELLRYSALNDRLPIVVSTDDTKVLGSPKESCWGTLHRVVGPNIETNVYLLSGDKQLIGREVGNIVFRDDGFVSGTHAQLTASSAGTAQIRDLDSSNGTYIRLREPYRAQDGDFLLLGQQLFHLHLR
ncbi:MAG: hypothetical protein COW42_04200 [Deltaproteobacteria bacterium CG17_big_fil_post_rev_8_21_14_2_50_63_7]|nr:MAG: hypothetical protein COW42_04200 [Deltaproteobacteria bacterium CG17_big_fil_post_rev_8_21_14_2_50_63_7]